jgi:hypothetical protein
MTQHVLDALTEAAMNLKKAELGEVKFSKSTVNDPHIQKVIDHAAAVLKVPAAKIIEHVEKEAEKFKELHAIAPTLYHTIINNVVEGQVFKLIKDAPVPQAPRFELAVFTALTRTIRNEHTSMFPLRNFVDHKSLPENRIRYVFVPGSDTEWDKAGIDTAAATPQGIFIFNTNFMQQLIDYAHLKGVNPKGKKYTTHGGNIPPEYCYIEFLIIHEFMHYTYADFHYDTVYKTDPSISNWVGDFRTNYDLVKSGYEQLPMGLFNDKINYDRQRSWKEMYDIVAAEFEKLNKAQQKKVKDQLGDIEGGQHGKGKPGESQGEGKGKGKGESKPGDKPGNKPGDKPGNGQADKKTPGDAEGSEQSSRDRAARGKDEGEGAKGDPSKGKPGTDRNARPDGNPGTGAGGSGVTDWTKYTATYSWANILRKLVRSVAVESTSYKKPSNKTIRAMHGAVQGRPAAISPATVYVPGGAAKLCIVVDSSGSMGGCIGRLYAELMKLLKSHAGTGRDLAAEFLLIKFSDVHTTYVCKSNGAGGSYKTLNANEDEHSGGLNDLFNATMNGGTVFSESLLIQLEELMKQKYNVLFLTDTDIIHGSNLANCTTFLKNRQHAFLILPNSSDFTACISAIQAKPDNISHM